MSGCLTVRLLGITGGLKGANEQQELLRKYRRSPSGKGGSLEASRKTDTVLGTRICLAVRQVRIALHWQEAQRS